jgi:hypothetical protein
VSFEIYMKFSAGAQILSDHFVMGVREDRREEIYAAKL